MKHHIHIHWKRIIVPHNTISRNKKKFRFKNLIWCKVPQSCHSILCNCYLRNRAHYVVLAYSASFVQNLVKTNAFFSNQKCIFPGPPDWYINFKNLIFELRCDIILGLQPLTFRFFIVFLVESPINCCWTQKGDMLASNLTSCPKFWTPVSFRIWKKTGNLLRLCLAKRCYCSSKISLKGSQTRLVLVPITRPDYRPRQIRSNANKFLTVHHYENMLRPYYMA